MARFYGFLAWCCGCLAVALLIVAALAMPQAALGDGGGGDNPTGCLGDVCSSDYCGGATSDCCTRHCDNGSFKDCGTCKCVFVKVKGVCSCIFTP